MQKPSSLGQALENLRKESGLSQKDLADAAGISRNYVNLIEKGEKRNIGDPILIRLGQALPMTRADAARFLKLAGAGNRVSAENLVVQETPISDALIAKAYWTLPPKIRCARQVADDLLTKYNVNLAPSRIEKVVARWEEKNWVEHRVWGEDWTSETPRRCVDLEQRLLEKYRIRHVMVAEVPDKAQLAKDLSDLEYDNQIHRHLGRMASAVFLAVLRKGDRVAVGSGRGPHECVAAAKERLWENYQLLDCILSVTGRMDVREWGASRGSPPLDADDVAMNLAQFLRAKSCQTVQRPIVMKEGQAKPDYLEFPSKRYPTPNIALIGVGVLCGGHRLCANEVGADLEEIQTKIDKLKEMVKGFDKHFRTVVPRYCCVADVCNLLEFVPAPRELDSKEKALRKQIDDFIKNDINPSLIAPTRMQLEAIAEDGAVIAVAGGGFKQRALQHILGERNKPRISMLVCDSLTASWLCSAAGQATKTKREKGATN
ncbi:MAG TPA: helix-turn-helix domain-containing protein [Gemmataceae bacterium]|nr:helix-turn-helix domain-containing protein [Gemmataceae bacterium]